MGLTIEMAIATMASILQPGEGVTSALTLWLSRFVARFQRWFLFCVAAPGLDPGLSQVALAGLGIPAGA